MTEQQPSPPERELLAGAAQGDAGALIGLYDLHGAALTRHLLARGLDGTSAERVVLRAFRALWIIAPRLRSDAPVQRHLIDLAGLHLA